MQRRFFIAGGLGVGGLLAAGPGWARQADASVKEIAVPVRLMNNRVLVDVTLNGTGPLSFVIDTGGMLSGVKQDLATRLNLKAQRFVRLNGANFPLYEVGEVVYGGAIRQPRVALFGVTSSMALGGDGLLAAGVVTAMDSRLEFENGIWRVFPDGAPPLPDGYQRLRSELTTNTEGLSLIPYADIAVSGRTQRALWDTGGPRPLSIHREAARGLGLLDPSVPYAPIPFSGIQGRLSENGRMVRVSSITVGEHTYENVLAAIHPANTPRHYDVLLGLPIIQTLDMAFDRASKSFAIRRNGLAVGSEPHYSRSGIWMEVARGRVRVADVGTGSPAALAGVQVGDILDGVSTLEDGVRLLAGPEGQAKELRLTRAGQSVTARFELKAYL